MGNYTENRQSGMTDENPVFRSLGVIEERIREKLTVKSLADSVHFSQYHYQRMFREAVGDSVMGYVARRRISLAAGELAETNASILEIALRYGYDSHEGFTRSFRAHMGITPTEYRRYHLSTGSLTMQKEKSAMIYSKATEEIIRELNSLIVQAKETAEYTRKSVEANAEAAAFYARFWNVIVDKTESMTESLAQILNRITAIARQPDEISARFRIIQAMEDTAFQSGMIAFQAGLTIARARPEHREVFWPVCRRYESLAGNARIKTGKIGEFMQELWQLIFQDMQRSAERKIRQAVAKGMAAVRDLSEDPALPYAYIVEEVRSIAEELSAMPLEEVTVARLENDLVRLDVTAFAVDMDVLRAPAHRALLETIYDFREEIHETAAFFRGLPGDVFCFPVESEQRTGNCKCDIPGSFREPDRGEPDGRGSDCRDSELWGEILLFYLKGEIEKLGDAHLTEEQRAVFDGICDKMKHAVHLAAGKRNRTTDRMPEGGDSTQDLPRQIYHELTKQGEELGIYGAAIRYLAEEWKRILLDPET